MRPRLEVFAFHGWGSRSLEPMRGCRSLWFWLRWVGAWRVGFEVVTGRPLGDCGCRILTTRRFVLRPLSGWHRVALERFGPDPGGLSPGGSIFDLGPLTVLSWEEYA
jgi:hypothetical protein